MFTIPTDLTESHTIHDHGRLRDGTSLDAAMSIFSLFHPRQAGDAPGHGHHAEAQESGGDKQRPPTDQDQHGVRAVHEREDDERRKASEKGEDDGCRAEAGCRLQLRDPGVGRAGPNRGDGLGIAAAGAVL